MSAPPRPSTLAHPAPPRGAWRDLALLTLLVAAGHVLLLALAPSGVERDVVPLGGRFSTRTIVLAPPEAPPPVESEATQAGARAPAAAPAPAPAQTKRATVRRADAAPARRAGTIEVARQATAAPSRMRGDAQRRPAASRAVAPEAPAQAPNTEGAASTPAATAAAAAAAAIGPDHDVATSPTADAAPVGVESSSVPVPGTEAAAVPAGMPEAEPDPTAASASSSAASGTDASASGGGAAAGSGTNETFAMGSRAMRIPASVRLRYAVTGQQGSTPMQGMFGELAWLQNGEEYDAQLALTFLFRTVRSQRSSGRLGSDGLAPDRFSDTRRAEQASHFVRDRGLIVFSNNKPSQALRPGAQDRLSVMVQLGALLAGDPARYPTGSSIAVQTVGPGDADMWRFQIEPDEVLDLPAGSYEARKLTRAPRRDFDDKVEIWLAPQIGHLPVRLRITQPNGDFADFQLRGVSPVGPPS